MRGRRPKPRAVRELQGNPGRRPLPEELETGGEIGGPPDWLSSAQKWLWRDVVAKAPRGVLTSADRGVLGVWIVAATLHRDASVAVRKFGSVVDGEDGPRRSPWVVVLTQQATVMLRAAEQLGFTPSSRPRIGAGLKAGRRERLAEFLFGDKGQRRDGGAGEGVN